MRVPIYVVIPLCLGVVGGVWWAGSRDRDFLTPPSEQELAMLREKAGGSVPPEPEETHSPEPEKPKSAPVTPPPPDDRPDLADYRDEARKDAASLMNLARQLEAQGELQKSLLAWERIIDSTAADETRLHDATQAIKRLREALPEWNADSAKALAIVIHAGTGKTTGALLAPVLEEIARELEQASSGILDVTASVAVGPDIPENRGPAPIALWFSGSIAESRSSEVFAFTIGTPETLRGDIAKNLFKLIRSYLGRGASLTVPEAITPDANAMDLISTHVTRLGWLELGTHLNKKLE